MKLKWDGSFLGSFKENIIQKKLEENNKKYFILEIKSNYYICRYNIFKTNLPCIIDEIKPFFKIRKTGTHSIQIGNKKYILYYTKVKQVEDEIYILQEIPLIKIHKSDELYKKDLFIHNVRMALAFKEITNFKNRINNTICLRSIKKLEIITVEENNFKNFENNKTLISRNALDFWFPENDLNCYVKWICGFLIEKNGEIVKYDEEKAITRLIDFLESTINRIDKNMVEVYNIIIKNCMSYI